jgi:hypothetical protein
LREGGERSGEREGRREGKGREGKGKGREHSRLEIAPPALLSQNAHSGQLVGSRIGRTWGARWEWRSEADSFKRAATILDNS